MVSEGTPVNPLDPPIRYGWVCPLCRRVMSPTTMYCCFCNPPTVSVYPTSPVVFPPAPLPVWKWDPNLSPTYTITSTSASTTDDARNTNQCSLYASQSGSNSNE